MKRNLWFSFLPIWIITNIIGWLIFNTRFYLPFDGLWVMLTAGMILGFFQWIVLQKYIGVDSMWIWASLLPYMLVHFTFYERIYFMDYDVLIFYTSLFVIFGLLGFLQFRVLEYYVHRPNIWLVLTPLLGLFGMLVSIILDNRLLHSDQKTYLLTWLFFGCLYGVSTGIALVLLETVFAKKQRFS